MELSCWWGWYYTCRVKTSEQRPSPPRFLTMEIPSSLVWFNYKLISTTPLTSLPCWKYEMVNIFHLHNSVWSYNEYHLWFYCCIAQVLTGVRCFLNEALVIGTLCMLQVLCSVYQCEVPQPVFQ